MAEAELSIEYRDWPTTAIHMVGSILWPISLFVLLWSSVVLLVATSNGDIHPGPAFTVEMLNLLLVALCGFVVFISSDNTIFITRDGLGLPFFVCMGPWLRAKKRWNELTGIQFNPANGGKLLLFFGRQPVSLKLSMLKPADIDVLVMALDVWAGGSEHFSALLDARAFIYQKTGGDLPQLEAQSYTEMWHEELARRFGSTTFIPLEPNDLVMDGQFKIEKQIAFGGLSAIYLARRQDGSRVVLKEAVVPDNSDEELKEQSYNQLKREADMLARLSHPQIARVFDHFVDKGRHYLVIEYLTGEDMRRLVKEKGPQSQEDVIAWGLEMAQILAYLHGQAEPILHRDFTPDNMILRPDGNIALIDFGAANFFLGTATGTMIGKQAYIAPEQLRGKANPLSDIYAMGGSLYFLLTGEDPEPLCESNTAAHRASVKQDLNELILSMTAMEEEDRPQGAETVLSKLQEIASKMKARK